MEADWIHPKRRLLSQSAIDWSTKVEWYIADRELKGRARELVKFEMPWIDGALVTAAPTDNISLAGVAAYVQGSGRNLALAGGYRTLVERLSAELDERLNAAPQVGGQHSGPVVVVHRPTFSPQPHGSTSTAVDRRIERPALTNYRPPYRLQWAAVYFCFRFTRRRISRPLTAQPARLQEWVRAATAYSKSMQRS